VPDVTASDSNATRVTTATRPTWPARTDSITESSPSVALTSELWMILSGMGNAPALSCLERFWASEKLACPVIWPFDEMTPWTAAWEST